MLGTDSLPRVRRLSPDTGHSGTYRPGWFSNRADGGGVPHQLPEVVGALLVGHRNPATTVAAVGRPIGKPAQWGEGPGGGMGGKRLFFFFFEAGAPGGGRVAARPQPPREEEPALLDGR